MAASDGYRDIGDYALIGDMNSAALVSKEGSIDWLCFPRFDSPSVFAALLDPEKGGRFAVSLAGEAEARQAYLPDTNVLRTVLEGEEGTLEVVDFMPCYDKGFEMEAFHEVHRRLRCVAGRVTVRVHFEPRLVYGADETQTWSEDGGCLAKGSREWLSLASDLPFEERKGHCTAEVALEDGDERWMVLRWNDDVLRPVEDFRPGEKLDKTEVFWKEWLEGCTYRGPARALVERSLLALKLLIYEPTGALVAAPTTSLPEVPGGTKNWDYRYSWLRDAAFALRAFHRCGFTEEERAYRHWVMRRLRGHSLNPSQLRVLYGVEGDEDLEERTLDHLRGYRDARPVRRGNEAHSQFQLDMFGALVDALYLSYHTDRDMNDHVWRTIDGLADFVAAHWRRPDSGMWELRGERQHYTHSKVMAWVGLDRAARVARRWGNPQRGKVWERVRDEIHAYVMENAYDEERGSFVQYVGGKETDGSLLIMPIVFFLDQDDPRWKGTLKRIREELGDGPLVRRFQEEGPAEGAFLMLSFWLVDALVHSGRLEEAEELFQDLAERANHVGLYAEMVDPETGRFLGNFPQAFTHMALVNAAVNLQQAREEGEE